MSLSMGLFHSMITAWCCCLCCMAWTLVPSRTNFASLPTSRRAFSVGLLFDSARSDGSTIPDVFPTSTRRAILLQKIQQQLQKEQELQVGNDNNDSNNKSNNSNNQNSSAISNSYYSYGRRGWSNRFGSVLTPAAIPGVYTADRPFYWNSIDVGCRMTIIELEGDGGLFIHSPVALDGPMFQLLQEWDQPVKYIVSPNYEHVKFAYQWHQAFPQAQMWGCPGLMQRLPQIAWTGEIPYGYRPFGFSSNASSSSSLGTTSAVVMGWEPEIQTLHVDTEMNPFTGKPFFNECIFYHQPSQTLLTTDLYWNYPPRKPRVDDDPDLIPPLLVEEDQSALPWTTTMWKFGMDQVFYPFYLKLMTSDKERFANIAKFLVDGNVWDVETLIPAHGDIVRGSQQKRIQSVLQQHFQLN